MSLVKCDSGDIVAIYVFIIIGLGDVKDEILCFDHLNGYCKLNKDCNLLHYKSPFCWLYRLREDNEDDIEWSYVSGDESDNMEQTFCDPSIENTTTMMLVYVVLGSLKNTFITQNKRVLDHM